MFTYQRKETVIKNTPKENKTGVVNGNELKSIYVFSLFTGFLFSVVCFFLKIDTFYPEKILHFVIEILFLVMLGITFLTFGIVTGFGTLALHTQEWTKGDKFKILFFPSLLGGVVVTAGWYYWTSLPEHQFLNHFLEVGMTLLSVVWSVVPYILGILMIKRNPKKFVLSH